MQRDQQPHVVLDHTRSTVLAREVLYDVFRYFFMFGIHQARGCLWANGRWRC